MISLILLSCANAPAAALVWQMSKSAAIEQARKQGKLVLMLAGRNTCGNCDFMKNTVCESASPPVAALVECEFVPWFCDVDVSREWAGYAGGLGSFILPLMCCIDPAKPNVYIDRTTNIQTQQDFYNRLLSRTTARATNIPSAQVRVENGRAILAVTNTVFGRNLQIERSADLKTWVEAGMLACRSRSTNWSEPVIPSTRQVFYRARIQ